MLCKLWFARFLVFFSGYFHKCVARSEKLVYDYYGLWLGKPSPGQKQMIQVNPFQKDKLQTLSKLKVPADDKFEVSINEFYLSNKVTKLYGNAEIAYFEQFFLSQDVIINPTFQGRKNQSDCIECAV